MALNPAERLMSVAFPAPQAKEIARQIADAGGGNGPVVDFATVSAIEGDWRGEGSETLLAALTALQLAVNA